MNLNYTQETDETKRAIMSITKDSVVRIGWPNRTSEADYVNVEYRPEMDDRGVWDFVSKEPKCALGLFARSLTELKSRLIIAYYENRFPEIEIETPKKVFDEKER